MPNTLVHFGVQALGSRVLAPRLDVRWLLFAPIIPDLPWIGQRILRGTGLPIDPYQVRLYAMVQASLLFCVVLSAAFALVSERPVFLFVVLLANSLAHLLLDAIEIKWANGVHLAAPLTWKLFSLRLVWPEHPAILGLTAVGLAGGTWLCLRARSVRLGWSSPGRLIPAALLLGLYLIGPALFLPAAERSNSHYVATWRAGPDRAGRPVEFDRERVIRDSAGARVRSFGGEEVRIANPDAVVSGTLSLQGRFLDARTIRVERAHVHVDSLRQLPTYLGLLLLAAAWLVPWLRRHRGPFGPR